MRETRLKKMIEGKVLHFVHDKLWAELIFLSRH
jgi:hypothetical protein